jgi:hypothetical protein
MGEGQRSPENKLDQSKSILITAGAFGQTNRRAGYGQWLHDDWVSAQKANNRTATAEDYYGAYEYEGYVVGASHLP